MVKQKKELNLLKDDIGKLFIKYLTPSLIGMLTVSLFVFVDTFCVGRAMGGEGLAALNISIPLVSCFYALGYLFGAGGATAFSICKGKGDMESSKKIFTLSLFLGALASALIVLFGSIYMENIAYFLGADHDNIQSVLAYLKPIIWFSWSFILSTAMNAFMRNDEAPKISMTATFVSCLMNIVLDVLFVFVFHWGLFGASIATALSQTVSLTFLLIAAAVRKKSYLKLTKLMINFPTVMRIMLNGFSTSMLELSVGAVVLVFNLTLIKTVGQIGVEAYGIISNLSVVLLSLIIGISQAIQPIISVNAGAGEAARVKKMLKISLITASCVGFCVFLAAELFPTVLAGIFVSGDPGLIGVAAEGIRLYFIAYLMMGFNIIMGAYFQSVEAQGEAILVSLGRGLVFVSLFLMIFSRLIGLNGIWLSVPAAELCTMVMAILLFLRKKRRGPLTVE